MKNFFTDAGYILLAMLYLPLIGLLYLVLWLFVNLPLQLREKLRYTAQCLRYGKPQGGM